LLGGQREITARLPAWLLAEERRHPPKSPMAQAVHDALAQWEALTVFLGDARVPLEDNANDRALRAAALGRRSSLFVGPDAAGENLAGLYSLVATCESSGFNPLDCLTDVLIRVQTHSASRMEELLPPSWAPRSAAA
jgi:transposase